MHSELKHILTIENLFDLPESTSSVDHKGKRISIKWLDGYQSERSLFYSRYALLDEKILIVVSSGAAHPYDIKKATSILENLHLEHKISDVDLIWDVRDIEKPSIKVRKAIIRSNNLLKKYWNRYFLIIPPKHKTLIRIYKFIYLRQASNVFFAESIENAINGILINQPGKSEMSFHSEMGQFSRGVLLEKSKEELVEIIENFTKNHEHTTDKILEAIGQITREGKFRKIDFDVNEQNLHFELVHAFSLLQQDVSEIIKEYKDLNKNLELKVAERIVDFIDKESNLRAILDNSDRVMWLMNNRYELIDFNLAFSTEIKRRYKNTPQINQNVLDILTWEKEKKIWKERFDAALQGKAGIYLDQDKFDGQERVMEIKTFPIKEIGKIKGVSVFIEDITEIKESQFKLIEKNRDLQKVNSELDSFVYRVSHDLRAPLTSILGLISLMKIETSQEKISEYIGLQEISIQKLDLFIKEIINLSRNSRLGITVSKIDFDGLLNEILESQNYTKFEQKIDRIVNIEKGISFYTDRQRLSIIINNLISNSLKYVNVHEHSPFVKINVYSENSDCIIEVSDNGIGISEAYLPKIFEMFFRATLDFSGSGLGLYIVKETVQKLKGKITVKSKTREGTTFKVVLPSLKDRFDAAPKLED